MIKNILTLALCAFSLSVAAEGYQVNMQSARQTGMGHVGAAMKLGAEGMHFNPATMVFMDNNVDISLGGSAIYSKISYSNNGHKAYTDNKLSTPIYGYAGFKIYDNLAAGVSITTPYGSSLNWGKDWIGADLIQDISLKLFNVQPTLSYKITDKLSVGAGLMLNFGNVSISRALLPKGALTAIGMGPQYKDIIPVSATLDGDANIRVGYNIGLFYDLNDRISFGASFRSCVKMKVKEGSATLAYASEAIKNSISSIVPPLDMGTFSSQMPMPANLNIGVAYKATDKLLVSAEIQTVFWSAYESLDILFNEDILTQYNIMSTKNYKNSVIGRVGAQYAVTDRLDVRGGIYFDQTPVRSNLLNPETPGMNKIGISGGLSFRPIEQLSIDFAMLYIQGLSRDGSIEYVNGLKQKKTFAGRYGSYAVSPSLGISLRF